MVIWSLVDVTKKMQLLVLKWKEFMWMVILWQRMKWRWWSCFNDSSFRITNQTTVRSRGYLCGASSLLKTKNGTEKDENLCHWVFCVSCVMHYVVCVSCEMLCVVLYVVDVCVKFEFVSLSLCPSNVQFLHARYILSKSFPAEKQKK